MVGPQEAGGRGSFSSRASWEEGDAGRASTPKEAASSLAAILLMSHLSCRRKGSLNDHLPGQRLALGVGEEGCVVSVSFHVSLRSGSSWELTFPWRTCAFPTPPPPLRRDPGLSSSSLEFLPDPLPSSRRRKGSQALLFEQGRRSPDQTLEQLGSRCHCAQLPSRRPGPHRTWLSGRSPCLLLRAVAVAGGGCQGR